MSKYHIDLTDEEAALVASAQLRVPEGLNMDKTRDTWLHNEGKDPNLHLARPLPHHQFSTAEQPPPQIDQWPVNDLIIQCFV